MRQTFVGLVMILVFSVATAAQTRPGPNVDVKRGAAGTPEITGMHPASIENGKETEVVVKGRDFPADAKLQASRECKLVRAKLISATEARFTVISTTEKGGYCRLSIIGKKSTDDNVEVKPTAAYQVILDKQKEEDRKAQAAREAKSNAESQKRMDYVTKTAPELVGKTWSVTLPNGQKDTWTLSSKQPGGGKFKSGAGQEVTIILQQGEEVMVVPQGGGCLMQGKLKDGKVAGEQSMPATYCKLGQGKWSATVSQ